MHPKLQITVSIISALTFFFHTFTALNCTLTWAHPWKFPAILPWRHMHVHRWPSHLIQSKSEWKDKDLFLRIASLQHAAGCQLLIAHFLSHTYSWRTSHPVSWRLFWSAICQETAATPKCCGRCCWLSSPLSWTQLWTCWLTWSVSFKPSDERTHITSFQDYQSEWFTCNGTKREDCSN